jgi:hypothetical protein
VRDAATAQNKVRRAARACLFRIGQSVRDALTARRARRARRSARSCGGLTRSCCGSWLRSERRRRLSAHSLAGRSRRQARRVARPCAARAGRAAGREGLRGGARRGGQALARAEAARAAAEEVQMAQLEETLDAVDAALRRAGEGAAAAAAGAEQRAAALREAVGARAEAAVQALAGEVAPLGAGGAVQPGLLARLEALVAGPVLAGVGAELERQTEASVRAALLRTMKARPASPASPASPAPSRAAAARFVPSYRARAAEGGAPGRRRACWVARRTRSSSPCARRCTQCTRCARPPARPPAAAQSVPSARADGAGAGAGRAGAVGRGGLAARDQWRARGFTLADARPVRAPAPRGGGVELHGLGECVRGGRRAAFCAARAAEPRHASRPLRRRRPATRGGPLPRRRRAVRGAPRQVRHLMCFLGRFKDCHESFLEDSLDPGGPLPEPRRGAVGAGRCAVLSGSSSSPSPAPSSRTRCAHLAAAAARDPRVKRPATVL